MPDRETPEEIRQVEQAKDYLAIYRHFVEILRTNKNINFVTFGIGNLTGRPGGDSAGRKVLQFNKDKNMLVDSVRHTGFFDRDVLDEGGNKLPMYIKRVVDIETNDSVILGFAGNVRGDKISLTKAKAIFHLSRTGPPRKILSLES